MAVFFNPGFTGHLDEYQQMVVLDNSRSLLVNAQVGSGKTTTLIAKIIRLHCEQKIALDRMVVLTFTNKAAGEIKERLRKALPAIELEDMPWFGTFHGVALQLLRGKLPVEKLGYSQLFTVIDPDEELELSLRLVTQHGLTIKYHSKIDKRLEALKHGRPLYGNMKKADDIRVLADLLKEEKCVQNKMDFDDLLAFAGRLLPDAEFTPSWVIIDEWQDCDEVQLEFARRLYRDSTKIMAVGDPNQMIYSWRGSTRDIFHRFKDIFEAEEKTLPVNYRSTQTILEAAERFAEKRHLLKGTRSRGEPIRVNSCYDAFTEAQMIASQIHGQIDKGIPAGEIAVLYRLQKQGKLLAEVLMREHISCEMTDQRSLKDYPALLWFVRLLRAAVNPRDRESMTAALGNRNYGSHLTMKQVEKVRNGEANDQLYIKIRQFPKAIDSIYSAADLFRFFDLDSCLSPTSLSYVENKALITRYANRLFAGSPIVATTPLDRFCQLLNQTAMEGTAVQSVASPDAVKLLTLHASKGLEFSSVFIAGVNNGLIPLCTSGNQQDEEEERRLFFVGLTRARNFVSLSYYLAPEQVRVEPGASYFLQFVPEQLLKRNSRSPTEGKIKADLHGMVSKIMQNREKKLVNPVFGDIKATNEAGLKVQSKVIHPKYGEGTVEMENEDFYEVAFPAYGIKRFSKDFCPLRFIDG